MYLCIGSRYHYLYFNIIWTRNLVSLNWWTPCKNFVSRIFSLFIFTAIYCSLSIFFFSFFSSPSLLQPYYTHYTRLYTRIVTIEMRSSIELHGPPRIYNINHTESKRANDTCHVCVCVETRKSLCYIILYYIIIYYNNNNNNIERVKNVISISQTHHHRHMCIIWRVCVWIYYYKCTYRYNITRIYIQGVSPRADKCNNYFRLNNFKFFFWTIIITSLLRYNLNNF